MDIKELAEFLLTPAAQVALIIGIAELWKRAGVPTRFIPLIDLALGLLSGSCVYGFMQGYPMVNSILIGIALGLSACGLFSGVKNMVEDRTDDEG